MGQNQARTRLADPYFGAREHVALNLHALPPGASLAPRPILCGSRQCQYRRRLARAIGVGTGATVLLAAFSNSASSEPSTPLDEIVITAQKWEQAADTVGMSVTAVTGELLRQRGIDSVAELVRLVPGFTLQQSSFNSTSVTLRGVGFLNSDLASPPAVTIYLNESPLPYPAMAKLVAFDLDRVEVMKGPQGTLFGQNSTGGAVNYIAAAPTETFDAEMHASYERFNRTQFGGVVSGPMTDELGFRITLQHQRGDAWQKSITRPGDELGDRRELQGRVTLVWKPDEAITSRLMVTATHDESETIAGQFLAPAVNVPPLAVPGLLTFPAVADGRAADWAPVRYGSDAAFPYGSDTTLYHLNWRNDFRLQEEITFTSLTSYADFESNYGQDPDGTPFHLTELITRGGEISSFFQELRVTGRHGKVNWLVGANYAKDNVSDQPLQIFRDNDVAHLFEAVDPQAYTDEGMFTGETRVQTYAAFGRIEFDLLDDLMLELGARYTDDERTFDNCSVTTSEHFARYWNLLRGGSEPSIQVGDCWVLDPENSFIPVDNVHSELNEESVSWRVGVNWSARPDLLLYANVSQGYKAGTAPVLAASTTAQLSPVPQESLVAYEAGIKTALFERRARLNAATFYYDYKDKQLRGAVLDPVFGALEALVSIPRSQVFGAEMQLVAHVDERFTFDTSLIYLDTTINEFTGFDALAQFEDHSGTRFPYSPKWQSITNVDYQFSVAHSLDAFMGASLIYNSRTFAGVGELDLFRIDSFALLDLRAGVEFGQGRYRLWAWGKNVTDEYYWTNVFANGNAISRFVGQPATYGLSLSAHF